MSLFAKNVLFTVLVPGTVGVYVPVFVFAHRAVASGWQSFAALLLMSAGTATYLWCIWDFASFGRGTPAPIDPPRHLVARGLYRYSRNPMYIGVLTVICGWALLFESIPIAAYGLVVGFCFHLFVVFYEEPALARQFGASYAQYRVNVRRWL